MHSGIVKLEPALVERLSELIFEGKKIELVDDLEFALKKILEQYGINQVDFLNARQLTETVCILKNIDYDKEFLDTGLSSMFSNKVIEEFITPSPSELTTNFDRDAVHDIIIIEFNKIVKKIEKHFILGSTNDKYSFRFEITGKNKTASIQYFIQRNKIDVYCLSGAMMHGDKIYLKRFQNLEYDLSSYLPPTFKGVKSIKTKHSYLPRVPYLTGFYLHEIERVLLIFESYNNETMVKR